MDTQWRVFVSPQNSYIKSLIPNNNTNVMVLEVGPSEGD